jgi:hypothetical protein
MPRTIETALAIIKMAITKAMVNAIYKALTPRSESVKRVQALFLWNRPIFSLLFFGILEGLFLVVCFLPFSRACNLCLVVGSGIAIYCIYSAFPAPFSKLLSFEIRQVDPGRSDRIRTDKEIAAFLATVLSIWTKILELVFASIEDSTLVNVLLSIAVILGLFLLTFMIGDFWFIWLAFHGAFVLPGVLLLPAVGRWLTEEIDGAAAPRKNTYSGEADRSSDGSEDPPSKPNRKEE